MNARANILMLTCHGLGQHLGGRSCPVRWGRWKSALPSLRMDTKSTFCGSVKSTVY